MPALFSLAQHPALEEVQGQLRAGGSIFAYLDDTYIIATPEWLHELKRTNGHCGPTHSRWPAASQHFWALRTHCCPPASASNTGSRYP